MNHQIIATGAEQEKVSLSPHRLRVGLILAATATALLLTAEVLVYLHHYPRVYFQAWDSEMMMQTVSIMDLRNAPLESLWNIHIQPPMFDAIRAGFAWLWQSKDGMQLLHAVDWSIYILWALLYGAMGFIVYWWVSEFARVIVAVIAGLLFYSHPASIYYATFLETTLLSAGLVLAYMYVLWRIGTKRSAHPLVVAVVFLALYFTRSLFQWPWILLFAMTLVILRYPRPKLITAVIVVAMVVGSYSVKQYVQFGTVATSTFTGLNLCKSIGWGEVWHCYSSSALEDKILEEEAPEVLARRVKINGAINYNHYTLVDVNSAMIDSFRTQVSSMSLEALTEAYRINAANYIRPSASLTSNSLVKKIPTTAALNAVYSGAHYAIAVFLAGLFILIRCPRSQLKTLASLSVTLAGVIVLSILFERGENMRYKYFVEPTVLIGLTFAAVQASSLARNYWSMSRFRALDRSEHVSGTK